MKNTISAAKTSQQLRRPAKSVNRSKSIKSLPSSSLNFYLANLYIVFPCWFSQDQSADIHYLYNFIYIISV